MTSFAFVSQVAGHIQENTLHFSVEARNRWYRKTNHATLEVHRLPPELFGTICHQQLQFPWICRADTRQV